MSGNSGVLAYQIGESFDSPISISAYISELLDRYQTDPNTMLLHLIEATLKIQFGDQAVKLRNSRISSAGALPCTHDVIQIGSAVLFVVGTAHEDHLQDAWQHAQTGSKVYLLVPGRTYAATVERAEQYKRGFNARVDIACIEQFVAQNLDEIGAFDRDGALIQLRRLLAKYNELVTQYEQNDPSLKIVIPDFGVA